MAKIEINGRRRTNRSSFRKRRTRRVAAASAQSWRALSRKCAAERVIRISPNEDSAWRLIGGRFSPRDTRSGRPDESI
jgi:hypothetical protein